MPRPSGEIHVVKSAEEPMVPRAEQACKAVIDEGEISQDQDRPESWWVKCGG